MTPHPSHILFKRVQRLQEFPAGVAPVPHQIQGTSFFPAGTGLFREHGAELPPFPLGGVMVLAHDWGTTADFAQFARNDAESVSNPTWRNLLPFLHRTGIGLNECYFTNFFIGLRTGKSSVGVFPGRSDEDYVATCRSLFTTQVEHQKPRLILVLGGHVPRLIAPTAEALSPWIKFASFKKTDEAGMACFREVRLRAGSHPFSVVLLVHPCYRQRNASIRRWNGLGGDEAEVAMVKHHC